MLRAYCGVQLPYGTHSCVLTLLVHKQRRARLRKFVLMQRKHRGTPICADALMNLRRRQ